MTIKTFEFKLTLNARQRRKIDHWMRLQNYYFNRGLALIEWREWHDKWQTVLGSGECLDGVEPVPMRWVPNPCSTGKEDEWVLACPRVKARKYDAQTDAGWTLGDDPVHSYSSDSWSEWTKGKSGKDKDLIVFFPHHEQVKPHWLGEPILPALRSNPYLDLSKVSPRKWTKVTDDFTENLDKVAGDCPQKFIQATLKNLANAWEAYREGDRERPRYKGGRRQIRTLTHNNTKNDPGRINGDYIRVDKLGWVKAKGLSDRWNGSSFCPMKIVKEPSGYYLQISYEVDDVKEKPNQRVVGLDLGGKLIYADDMGHVALTCDTDRIDVRLKQLQQKLSRQYLRNKHNPDWQRKNLHRTRQQIARLHERIRRRRNGYAHYLADRVVSLSDVIVMEDIALHGMRHRNGAKVDESGRFEKNGQSAASGRNRVMAEASPGLFRLLVEQKAAERGRRVHYVPAEGTSKACYHCDPGGFNWKNANTERPLQNLLWCQDCGRLVHADINAAKNIRARGLSDVFGDGTSRRQKRSTRKGAGQRTGKKTRELAPT